MDKDKSLLKRVLAFVDNMSTVLYMFTQLIITLPPYYRDKAKDSNKSGEMRAVRFEEGYWVDSALNFISIRTRNICIF